MRLPVLPPDLAAAADYHAEVTGVSPCGTCPNARVRNAGPWAFEVFRALRLMRESKGAMRFADITGRAPHVWDVRALDTITTTWAAAAESDEAIRKAEAETNRDREP